MRLHRLRIQAFGPFAGAEEVDVDALAAQGLFLLHGPTGAGKTSVLDALCFALYGRVPGARPGGGLRSHHSEAGLAPEVRCEFTAAGRRFEVTRSPAWDRPKKRGEGTTTEQARTLLREKVDGSWVPRSSRNDEAAQLLTDVLGMGMEQFTQVVLLPQGDFAAFLRAPADERRALLQRLFGTDRFADVEAWLVEARRTTARALERADADVDRLIARVEEAAAVVPCLEAVVPGPAAGADDDAEPDGAGDLRTTDPAAYVQAVTERALLALAGARTVHQVAQAELATAREHHDHAVRAAERAVTLTSVLSQQTRLESDAARVEVAAAALARGDAAAGVAGHLSAAAAALTRVQVGTEALRVAEQAASAHITGPPAQRVLPDHEELAARVRAAREQVGRLDDLLDAERVAAQATARAAAADRQVATFGSQRARCEGVVAALHQRRFDADARAQALTEPAGTVAVLEAELAGARLAHAAAVDAARLTEAADGLRSRALAAGESALVARRRWLDVREARLAGIAAELAASLAPGSQCPVCGSVEHPLPAAPARAGVSSDDEATARELADDAEEGARTVDVLLATAREQLAGATSRSGGVTSAESAARVSGLARRLDDARHARADLVELTSSVVALDLELERAQADAGQAAEQLAAARAEAGAEKEKAALLDARLVQARGEHPTVAARRESLAAQARALEGLATAAAELDAARAAHAGVLDAAASAVASAGFAGLTEAVNAGIDDEARDRLRTVLGEHAQELAAVRSRLAEADLVLAAQEAAEARVTDDPAARLATAEAASHHAVEQVALLRRATSTLTALHEHVAADAAVAAPLRARHDLVTDLARCAEGNGGGNALRMRLSAFVLAARLEQVAAAATVRLDEMSSGRYALVHSDAVARAGARSGLGLQVVDAWTGSQRETASLSGGEAFMASLSLALGLADVVQAEAGGSVIETLFVDEGFGSLDEDALDEVMATLDTLREGGRAVGLVSHVAELRQRVPARLEVVKTRTGSHLRAAAC